MRDSSSRWAAWHQLASRRAAGRPCCGRRGRLVGQRAPDDRVALTVGRAGRVGGGRRDAEQVAVDLDRRDAGQVAGGVAQAFLELGALVSAVSSSSSAALRLRTGESGARPGLERGRRGRVPDRGKRGRCLGWPRAAIRVVNAVGQVVGDDVGIGGFEGPAARRLPAGAAPYSGRLP